MANKKSLVVHIIVGLGRGGAETTLCRLCENEHHFRHHVISLTTMGPQSNRLRACGVEVTALGMTPGIVALTSFWKLWIVLRKLQPEAVQTWMYHSDLIGGLIAKLLGIKNIVWNIRHTSLTVQSLKFRTLILAGICSLLSYFVPKKIICCSREAMLSHNKFGYCNRKMVVIENGFIAPSISRQSEIEADFRKSLDLQSGIPLIGMVARIDTNKDHLLFIRAIKKCSEENPNFHSMLVGLREGVETSSLQTVARKLGLASRITWLGPQSDLTQIYVAMDFHVLASKSEGFPNVVAEAMLHQTPCISTRVGSAERIIGETGWTVEVGNEDQLAAAILMALKQVKNNVEWRDRCVAARDRIQNEFSVNKMVCAYRMAWSSSLSGEPLET